MSALAAPFPFFGGKRSVAPLVWSRLGDVAVYVEPFAGSLAVLLGRPHEPRVETVNDLDGQIANVWRAIRHDPEQVAYYADDLVSEVDLHSRHALLVRERASLTERLLADPDAYDARLAGWWIWGASCWIGSGWCSGRGPWQVVAGRLVKTTEGAGIERTRPHLSDGPRGVERKRPHLMTAGKGVRVSGDGQGMNVRIPQVRELDGDTGMHRKVPHLIGSPGRTWNGKGVHAERGAGDGVYSWMAALSDRLRRVRVCCGGWQRVLGPAGTTRIGLTGVFLDPPYRHEGRDREIYTTDEADTWEAARAWAAAHGGDPRLRIVLAGYSDQPATVMPAGWTWRTWKSAGGYGSQGTGQGRANAGRECLFFSPQCLAAMQPSLFDQEGVS